MLRTEATTHYPAIQLRQLWAESRAKRAGFDPLRAMQALAAQPGPPSTEVTALETWAREAGR